MVHAESPLQFYVNNTNSPNVTASGPGLIYGLANKTATFTIYTEDAAEGTGSRPHRSHDDGPRSIFLHV